jgi:hypothetical protein
MVSHYAKKAKLDVLELQSPHRGCKRRTGRQGAISTGRSIFRTTGLHGGRGSTSSNEEKRRDFKAATPVAVWRRGCNERQAEEPEMNLNRLTAILEGHRPARQEVNQR